MYLYGKTKCMNKNSCLLVLFFFSFFACCAQDGNEIAPPPYIKTAYFAKGAEAVFPLFRMGERFTFTFDDLMGDESDYYYQIKHYNEDWTPSQLSKREYISGMDDLRIQSYTNSVNTLQSYTHYQLQFPDSNTRFLVSGNYMLIILNVDREVVFSRRFVLYEEQITIGVQPKRTRDFKTTAQKQNIEIHFDYGNGNYLNPRENFKIAILQNGRWDNAITKVKPQFMIGTKFSYQYDKETQFWGGNEYWYFDNSDIMQVNNMVAKVTSDSGIFNTYLYPFVPKTDFYTFYNDINGSFLPRNKFRQNGSTEADYAWVYFSLRCDEVKDRSVYVVGLFNSYQLTDENKMKYNVKTQTYEGALLMKQGFTNYRFVAVSGNNIDDARAVDGNFYETENNYQVLLYYRGGADRYDRIIGFGEAQSINITN